MEKTKKIRIAYATKTGHSKKIAEAIAKELQVEAVFVKDGVKVGEADLLFIIGGIYGGHSLPELIHFAESLDHEKVKKVALITSSMAKTMTQSAIRSALIGNEIEVEKDEFACQGSFLFFGLGHPNKKEIGDAVAYAKRIAMQLD